MEKNLQPRLDVNIAWFIHPNLKKLSKKILRRLKAAECGLVKYLLQQVSRVGQGAIIMSASALASSQA